jgi:TonB-dependent starch-binding outer membrane protein SusC
MKVNLYNLFRPALLFVLLIWCQTVSAQSNRVTGRVSGPDGGIPGANVVVKGTTTGTSTDAEGNFAINANANATLVISAIGFQTREVAVGNQSKVTVSLVEDVNALSEVIVTGYTTDERRNTTGSVATVKAKDLAVVPTGNVEQLLQGRVSGVTVITNGQPGTNSTVRIRGFGAFGGNEPLYVVDGVPVGDIFNGVNFISPDDIESTTVLKDATAASIYGARAANGVIVITTKRGTRKARKLTVTYDGSFGITTPGSGQPILNPQEQADWTWNAIRNTTAANNLANGENKTPDFSNVAGGQYGSGATPVLPEFINVGGRAGVTGGVDLAAEKLKYNIDRNAGNVYQVVRANKAGTDWYGAITRNAALQRHTIGVSGGTDASRYYFGFSAQDQQGILLNNTFRRYTLRANSEFDILKNLRFGQNFQATYRQVRGQGGGNGGQNVAQDENDILTAFRMPPIIPVYDEFGGYAGTAAKGFNNPRNPVASREASTNDRNFNANAFGNVYLEYDPIPGLTLRSSLGGQYNNYYYNFYSRLQYENSENNASYGYGEGSGYVLAYTLTNTANYKRKFGIHSIDVLAGQEALNTGSGRAMDGFGINPFSTDPNYVTLSTVQGSGRQVNSGLFAGVNFSSLFGRAVYSYNDKYYLTGVIRRDGASRFGANNRYGVFPSVSAAWRVSAEPFMKDLPWVSDLKVRGGYGLMGNSNNVNPNNQYSLYASNIGSGYDLAGSKSSVTPGFFRSRIGNPDAKWETAITTNVGFDGTFLGGKVDFIFDLWRKDTRDLLFQVPLAGVIGTVASAPSVNIASMRNQGIDLQLITRGRITGDLNYQVDLTGSFLQNEVQSLAPGVQNFQPANFRNISPVQIEAGRSISAFYGYKVTGLWQSAAEIAAANAAAPKTADGKTGTYQSGAGLGRFRYADVAGVTQVGPTGERITTAPDGQITADDRTYLGSPVPTFTGGAVFTLKYKGFDLETYLYTSLGGKIYNFSKWYNDFYGSFTGAAISRRVLDSWTPQNTGATIPVFEDIANFSTNTVSNSYYIESGDYLRMQSITLGYTLPANLSEKLRLQRLRLFVQTSNVFTITGYSGLDPAVGGSADTNFGIDVGNYPVTRGFNAGLGLTF